MLKFLFTLSSFLSCHQFTVKRANVVRGSVGL